MNSVSWARTCLAAAALSSAVTVAMIVLPLHQDETKYISALQAVSAQAQRRTRFCLVPRGTGVAIAGNRKNRVAWTFLAARHANDSAELRNVDGTEAAALREVEAALCWGEGWDFLVCFLGLSAAAGDGK